MAECGALGSRVGEGGWVVGGEGVVVCRFKGPLWSISQIQKSLMLDIPLKDIDIPVCFRC